MSASTLRQRQPEAAAHASDENNAASATTTSPKQREASVSVEKGPLTLGKISDYERGRLETCLATTVIFGMSGIITLFLGLLVLLASGFFDGADQRPTGTRY